MYLHLSEQETQAMNSPASFLTIYVLVASAAVVITLLWGMRAAISRAALPAREQRRSFRAGTTLLVGWFLAALSLSWLGFYQGTPMRIPTVEFGLLLPIIAGVLFYWRSAVISRIIAAAPQSLLVGVQLYRVLGIIFLVLFFGGAMPGVFAIPAGAGDLAVGLFALAFALASARGLRGSSGLVRAWNLLGLTDLAVAVTTGFLSSPSPIQSLAIDNPNNLITAFPLVMIPVFLVPLAVLLHLASLAKLGQTETLSDELSPLLTTRGTSSQPGESAL
jgi:hypothetical protein